MKGVKKCYGLLLLLFIIFGLSLSVCSDTNALQYDYAGIPLLTPIVPNSMIIRSDGRQVIDWNNAKISGNNTVSVSYSSFYVDSNDGSASDYYNDIRLKDGSVSSYVSFLSSVSNDYYVCDIGDNTSVIKSLLYVMDTPSGFYVTSNNNGDSYFVYNQFKPENLSTPSRCRYLKPFNSLPQPFLGNSKNDSLLGCKDYRVGNYDCFLTFNAGGFFKDKIYPYWFSTNGFYTHDSVTLIDGTTYEHNFSISELFNKDITTISEFRLPLYDDSFFWIDADNFYAGRHFEFSGAFSFKGSFTLNPDFNNSVSFKLKAYLFSQNQYEGSSGSHLVEFPCQARVTQIQPEGGSTETQFRYNCSFDLPFDSPFMYPFLHLDAGDSYVWQTDQSWSFVRQILVTDNDTTPGGSFGNELAGNFVPGKASNYVKDEDTAEGIFDNLINLFTIDFFNPFSPIFNMFGSGSQCADIPIIASMLYSTETRVCPFFSASIRDIVTPVIGLFSAMLTFGFAISWLKGRSSDILSKGDKE